MTRRLVALCLAFAAVPVTLIAASPAQAATIVVTTTADAIDAAGACATVTLAALPGPDGQTSLREAVCAANTNPGPDVITFSIIGIFALTGAANEDNGGSGDLDVKQSLAIVGIGAANTVIDGGGIERIFDVFPSAATTFDLTELTVRNGDTRLTSLKEGGAIYLHSNVTTTLTSVVVQNNFSGANGAIENRGILTIDNSVISDNQTIPVAGSVVGGGGLHNAGVLSINDTTIANNSVRGEGGGIATTSSAAVTVSITNSTISGNTASVVGGGLGNGGGMSTTGNEGTINITNSTISGNHADNNGGGAYWVTPGGGTGNLNLNNVTFSDNTADNDNNGAGAGGGLAINLAAVTLTNTIVAGNFNSIASVRDDISGTVVASSSYNLIGDGTGSVGIIDGVNNNQVGSSASPIDPVLGGLADNGGPTFTHALLAGSTAINAADNATCAATDQRGVARPVALVCDIGAYELDDLTPPNTTITSNPPDPSTSSSATFTFTGSDTGGSGLAGFQCQLDVGGFAPCTSPQSYTSLGNGSHTFQVRAIDGIGNVDPAPASYTWLVDADTTPPGVTINQASDQADPTMTSPVHFTAAFTEPVSGFTTGDVTLSGTAGATTAAVTEESPNDGTTYDIAISGMTTNGTVIASIAADVAADGTGNGNSASTSTDNTVTFFVDATRPNVVLVSNASDPTNASIPVTAHFSEIVTGFTATDVVAGNASVANFVAVDGATYTFDLVPSAEGLVTADVPEGVATDGLGNPNTAAAQFRRTFDSNPPAVTIDQASGQADPTSASPVHFVVVFAEPVSDFVTGEVTLSGTTGATNATVTEMSPNDGTTYDVAVSGMTTNGTVTASIAAGVATDAAGNGNTASSSNDNTVTFLLDATRPDVALTSAASDPTNASIPVTAEFSEIVTGFTDSDIVAGNAGVANFVAVDGDTYTFDLVPLADGFVTVDVPAGVAIDAVGNSNTAATTLSRTYDATGPTVTINQAIGQVDPTSVSPVHFTVMFTEPVSNFVTGDVTLSGTVGATTAIVTEIAPNDGTTYDVAVSGMTHAGTVIASVPARAGADDAGNGNLASTSTDNTVTFNVNVAPTATVTNGQCAAPNIGGGTINLTLADPDGDTLTLTFASNSNTTLVPNTGIVIAGTGNNRMITATAPAKTSDIATLTFNLSDGTVTVPVVVSFRVGTDNSETLNGTSGIDMIFGLAGSNTINGNAGNDLLCGGNSSDIIRGGDGNDILDGQNGSDDLIGGNGNDILRGSAGSDELTGGSGGDSFSGGQGTDNASDFNPAQGDTQDGTIP